MDRSGIVDRLRTLPGLATSPDDRLERVADLVRPRTALAGTLLISRNEPGDTVYLLVSGRARLCLVSPDGRELTLSYLEAPSQFGTSGVIEGRTRAADVVAVSDVEMLLMDRGDLERAITVDPGLALDMMAGLSERLRDAIDRLEELAFHDAGHRVMRVLLNVATASFESVGAPVVTGLTHYEIGALAGTSRETASRVIPQLARDGVVLSRGRRIFVDLFKLRELLGEG